MKGDLEAAENYCDDQQYSSFLDDYKLVFGRTDAWLSLCKARVPFLDKAEKELVEGLGARVTAGPARTEGTDPCLMYRLWKQKLQNSSCRHSH